MRNSVWLAFMIVAGGAAYGTLEACAGAPQIVVHTNPIGKSSETEQGDVVKFTRRDSERYAGHKPGFFVMRSADEWDQFWADAPAGQRPARPLVNFGAQMLLLGYADSADAAELRLVRVIDAGGALHVYVEEKISGAGCPPKTDGPFDVVAVERTDKPTHFHVDRIASEACDTAPPTGRIICRKSGASDWSEHVQAAPGETVECEADRSKSKSAAAEQNWGFSELPPGSMAKLSFLRDGTRVSFPIDSFGRYGVTLELADEDGHRSTALSVIESQPPAGEAYLELVWTGFDPNDDPSTFPRVELHVSEAAKRAAPPPRAGAAPVATKVGHDCSLESASKPAWCEVKNTNYLTLLHLRTMPNGPAGYDVEVHYTDDRFVGGPIACVRGFLDGKATADRCDRLKRAADSTWKVGVIEAKTATFVPEGETLGSAATHDGGAPAAPSDGGAPVNMKNPDASIAPDAMK